MSTSPSVAGEPRGSDDAVVAALTDQPGRAVMAAVAVVAAAGLLWFGGTRILDRGNGAESAVSTDAGSAPAAADTGRLVNGLQVEVDSILLRLGVASTVTGFVGSDGSVDLNGTVTSKDTRSQVEAEVSALDGASNVVNSLTVVEPLPEADGFEAVEQNTINVALSLDPVTFETNSAVITAEGRAVADLALAYLIENPDVEIEIAGHTDALAENDFNMTLSQERADVVRDYLELNGVDRARMTAIGYGETRPVASNETDEGRAANRRIEFVILEG